MKYCNNFIVLHCNNFIVCVEGEHGKDEDTWMGEKGPRGASKGAGEDKESRAPLPFLSPLGCSCEEFRTTD